MDRQRTILSSSLGNRPQVDVSGGEIGEDRGREKEREKRKIAACTAKKYLEFFGREGRKPSSRKRTRKRKR